MSTRHALFTCRADSSDIACAYYMYMYIYVLSFTWYVYMWHLSAVSRRPVNTPRRPADVIASSSSSAAVAAPQLHASSQPAAQLNGRQLHVEPPARDAQLPAVRQLVSEARQLRSGSLILPAITRLHDVRRGTPSPGPVDQHAPAVAADQQQHATAVRHDVSGERRSAGALTQQQRYDQIRHADGSLLQRSRSVKVTSTPLLQEMEAAEGGGGSVTNSPRASKRHPTAHGFPVIISDVSNGVNGQSLPGTSQHGYTAHQRAPQPRAPQAQAQVTSALGGSIPASVHPALLSSSQPGVVSLPEQPSHQHPHHPAAQLPYNNTQAAVYQQQQLDMLKRQQVLEQLEQNAYQEQLQLQQQQLQSVLQASQPKIYQPPGAYQQPAAYPTQLQQLFASQQQQPQPAAQDPLSAAIALIRQHTAAPQPQQQQQQQLYPPCFSPPPPQAPSTPLMMMPPAGYNSSLSALTGQLPAAAAVAPGNHPGYAAAANFNALQQAPPVSAQLPGVADVAAAHGANIAAATALELNRRASTGQLPYVPPAAGQGQTLGGAAFSSLPPPQSRLHGAASQHQYHPASSLGVVHEGAVTGQSPYHTVHGAYPMHGGDVQAHSGGLPATRSAADGS